MFQSLPDAWAIKQYFPMIPIHRLNEEPTREAVISDVTCDCEGQISSFMTSKGQLKPTLPVHDIAGDDETAEYIMGVFLVGAYQETLGVLHNLLGDTSVVTVRLKNGKIEYTKQLAGDTNAEVLSYLEYEPRQLIKGFRELADSAVQREKVSEEMAEEAIKNYRKSLRDYTYFTT